MVSIIYLKKFPLLLLLMFCLFLLNCGSKEDADLIKTKTNSAEKHSGMSQPYSSADRVDAASIDGIVKAIYESITFSENENPDMARFQSLCAPNAPFVRIQPDRVDKMDLESFLSSFQDRVESGALKSFYEGEISRKTNQYGSIAQVFSTYKKGMNTEDPESLIRGINCFQLYYDSQRWWISCLIWEDESPENPIPDKYLSEKRE